MKEELIRVLNNKLDDINVNINSLVELNGKIDNEKNGLAYTNKVLSLFQENNSYNVLNFTKLSKDDFEKIVEILGESIKEEFNTNSCNYDGLVYLINGINNGVSLTLTDGQNKAINDIIQGLKKNEEEHESAIDGLMLIKERFPISDVEVLNKKHDDFTNIVKKIEIGDYVSETEEIEEAIEFSKLNQDKIIDILSYLLKYNADIYDKKKDYVVKEVETVKTNEKEELPDFTETKEEFHFTDLNSTVNTPIIEPVDEIHFEDVKEETPIEEKKEDLHLDINLPKTEEENPVLDDIKIDSDYEEYNIPSEETISISPVQLENNKVNSISTRELQRLFSEYNLKFENDVLTELLVGDIDNYRNILDVLKENNLLKEFEKNRELFILTLLSTTKEEILSVLKIIHDDLSVDEDDYRLTTQITINTIPSIFVKEDGNYDNFVQNVKMFKDLGINLINLYDFSKEVLVADHKNMLANYQIVKNYNVNLDYRNIKYLLLLPNIGEKLDYYVESVYKDRTKNNEKFDGITYINNYPNKLNSVCDLTIKRLRYSSENARKVFGTKPNSLVGEITNLKVNVLELGDEYLNSFFNNEFDNITSDEIREYTKLIRNSSNIGNYTDELAKLEIYHNGLRYTINDINISYNKVVRNYNTLRSYGINKTNALIFAVCHNLVITKEEYQSLKNVLIEIGGSN